MNIHFFWQSKSIFFLDHTWPVSLAYQHIPPLTDNSYRTRLEDWCTTPNQTQPDKETMHQGSQVFSLGRVSLTYIESGQLNHINDNSHAHAGNNPSTWLGPPWNQTHNWIRTKVTTKQSTLDNVQPRTTSDRSRSKRIRLL